MTIAGGWGYCLYVRPSGATTIRGVAALVRVGLALGLDVGLAVGNGVLVGLLVGMKVGVGSTAGVGVGPAVTCGVGELVMGRVGRGVGEGSDAQPASTNRLASASSRSADFITSPFSENRHPFYHTGDRRKAGAIRLADTLPGYPGDRMGLNL